MFFWLFCPLAQIYSFHLHEHVRDRCYLIGKRTKKKSNRWLVVVVIFDQIVCIDLLADACQQFFINNLNIIHDPKLSFGLKDKQANPTVDCLFFPMEPFRVEVTTTKIGAMCHASLDWLCKKKVKIFFLLDSCSLFRFNNMVGPEPTTSPSYIENQIVLGLIFCFLFWQDLCVCVCLCVSVRVGHATNFFIIIEHNRADVHSRFLFIFVFANQKKTLKTKIILAT